MRCETVLDQPQFTLVVLCIPIRYGCEIYHLYTIDRHTSQLLINSLHVFELIKICFLFNSKIIDLA